MPRIDNHNGASCATDVASVILRTQPIVLAIEFEMTRGGEALEVASRDAALQMVQQLLCLRFATVEKERLGTLDAGTTDKLSINVASGIE